MTKRKYQRIIIRPELIRDARKIQKAYSLANLSAAINLVFAMYRGQVLEQIKNHPDEAASKISAAKKTTACSNSKESLDVSPSPSTVVEPSGGSLRNFLQAKVREDC